MPKPRAALEKLFGAMQARREGCRLAALGSLFEFLAIIMEEKLFNEESEETAIRSAHNVAKFGNVFSLIRNKCDTPITLEDMASEANMSPNYFCQAFKEATHYTPIEYLTHYRIEFSKYLLCAKDCTVQEATFAAGFASPAYFIKIFKRATGVTPNRYKKDHRLQDSETRLPPQDEPPTGGSSF